MLFGREREAARIDEVLDAARDGRGGALVIRGEAGIGKTALLNAAIEHAEGMRVLRALGVESEVDIAFSGLHELLRPALSSIDAIPDRRQSPSGRRWHSARAPSGSASLSLVAP
jgi:hypothetical protein